MNRLFTKLGAIACLGLLLFASCKKDEVKVIATNGTPGTLSATTTSVALSADKASTNATTFNYTATSYGFNAAPKYTLQIDKQGNNFASAKEYPLSTTGSSQAFTVSDFNTMLILMGFSPNNPAQVQARIKTELGTNVNVTYSNVVSLSATPYLVVINYPSVYVPGAYQGWAPDKAPKLSSVTDNKVYEGYVNVTGSDLNFKITSEPDWNHTNYGTGGAGKLDGSSSAGNLTFSSTGYFLVNANLNNLTWSATKTTWGVIGDATPGGWDTDTDMTYDATSQTWTATVALTAGGHALKFRANHAWDLNYGDNKPANGLLKAGGENIPVTVAGNYKIVLDLSKPGNYTYTLTKL